jgi:hypothetical protein
LKPLAAAVGAPGPSPPRRDQSRDSNGAEIKPAAAGRDSGYYADGALHRSITPKSSTGALRPDFDFRSITVAALILTRL